MAHTSTSDAPVLQTLSLKGAEMEQCRAPSFTGKTINYLELRRGQTKVAAVPWEDGNQVDQIRCKVKTETHIISRCSTLTEVWEILDAEYVHEQEFINAVELYKL